MRPSIRQLLITAISLFCLDAGAFAVDETYSIFTVPPPSDVILTADDDLVPQAITDDGFYLLFSLRNRSTGAVAWYSYRLLNGGAAAPVALSSTVNGYQHVHYHGFASGSGAAFGWAWNEDQAGAVTAVIPVLCSEGYPAAAFGTLQGRFICGDGAGPNLYGQVFAAPSLASTPSATGRAGFWIPSIGTSPGYPLTSTSLKDVTAIVGSEAKRTWFDSGGSYTNGDYLAGSYTNGNGGPGFWRYLRPVGDPWTFELVQPPAGLKAGYSAATISWANCGVVGSGEAVYRLGDEQDAAVPLVSFFSSAGTSTLIRPPSDISRNVVRCHDLAKYGSTITAVGFAKHRSGNALTGSDSSPTAWIWHPGDARATNLKSLVPRKVRSRLGTNAAAISLGVNERDGGQIVIDGWDPGTTTVTPADKRILVLSRVPTLTLTTSASTMAENPQGSVSIGWSADPQVELHWPLTVTYVLGGSAVKDVDYFIGSGSSGSILSQNGDTVVVSGGGFVIEAIDNNLNAHDKTITVTLADGAAHHDPTTAYRVAAPAKRTITLVNDDLGPATRLSRSGTHAAIAPVKIATTFAFAVTGYTSDDVTVSAGTLSVMSGSGSTYTTIWTPPAGQQGTATLHVPGGVALSASGGHPNLYSNDLVIPYDTRRPIATLSGGNPLTTASGANFGVNFDEGVTGMSASDFQVTGGTIRTGSFAHGDNWCSVYVDFTALDIAITYKAGAAADAAGNTNAVSNTVNITRPANPVTVTINQSADQPDPAPTLPMHWTIVFSDTVDNFSLGYTHFSGTAGMFIGATMANPSNDKRTFIITVYDCPPGSVIIDIPADMAFHGTTPNTASTSTDNSVTYQPPAALAASSRATSPAPPAAASGGGGCGFGSGIVTILLTALFVLHALRAGAGITPGRKMDPPDATARR
jgi:hypothetical protein